MCGLLGLVGKVQAALLRLGLGRWGPRLEEAHISWHAQPRDQVLGLPAGTSHL